ncbi:uridine permease-like protein Fui1, partial [Aureobasidium melanogenum]
MGYEDVKGDASGKVTQHSVEPVQLGDSSPYTRRTPRFKLAVDQEPSSFATNPNASNADFDPIPPSKRTWTWKAYVAYWMADAWAVSNWEVASSMIASGLSWRMAIGACVLGNFIMGLVITMNGRIGAHLHTPFPILARISFGYYFSYFVVVSRCILAIIWLGVQTVTGGQCMEVLLTAIWPSFAHIPNHIAADQGITTAGMCGFVLYFLLQLPFLCIPYTKVQYFFGLKSIIAPIIFLAVFGSTLHKAGGTISHSPIITEGPTVKGSVLVWAFFSNLNSVLGNYATLGLNIADFARYSNKRSAQNCQAFVIPFIFTIVGLLGIFTAAASVVAYPAEVAKEGTPLWNPVVIVGLWSASGSHAGRAASAFGAIGLIIVTLGINISANSISAANDLVSFFPKYINIRHGQILAAIIGAWACVPWKILASAQKFLSFLGGYTIFLGPMTAIIMTDYYIVRRGNVSVPEMYKFDGIYRYSPKFASNWRAVLALVIGFLPPLPGFADSIDQGNLSVSLGGQHLFAIGYMYSFVAAGLCYWALMRFAPEQGSRLDHQITGEEILIATDERNGRTWDKEEKKGFSVKSWISKHTDSDSSVA